MIKTWIALFFLATLAFGCTSKKQHAGNTKIFLAYKGGQLPIYSLNIKAVSMEFFDHQDKSTLITLDKRIELALREPEFLQAFSLPAKEYHRIKLHISLEDHTLILPDTEKKPMV